MNTKQAKDFLVQQASEQAALENVSLSDLEKRMMYFTESDPPSCENPFDLNAEFEAQYDTEEYELKVSRLLHQACRRLEQEGPEKLPNWKEAIQTLREGDHYILVLLGVDSTPAPQVLRIWVVFAWGIGLGVGLVILLMLWIILNHYWNNSR
jgi:hypothetical protein